MEDLIHFVLDCGALEEQRCEAVELQRPRFEQEQDVVGEFLFGGEENRRKRETLMRKWRRRLIEEGID